MPEGTWVALRGSSMQSAYADGDWLLVAPFTAAAPVRLGEVVVARRGERLVTHRVVELRDGMATTKGDACPRADPPVPVGALLGRVVSARRDTSRFRGWRFLKRRIRRLLKS